MDLLHDVLRLLTDHQIPACVIGEIALNYYNVPRVVHDMEICVPATSLSNVETVLRSQAHLCEPARESDYDLYSEYRRDCPRFRFLSEPQLCLTIFADEQLRLQPIQSNLIPATSLSPSVEYSKEILDTFSADEIALLPLPKLPPLFRGLCQVYCSKKDIVSAIAAEQLVDGMDLDPNWSRKHLRNLKPDEIAFANRLVKQKTSRIDDLLGRTVTCFIENEQDAQRIRRIPGRD